MIEHTEKEFDEALRAELEEDVLSQLGLASSPGSPKYPPASTCPAYRIRQLRQEQQGKRNLGRKPPQWQVLRLIPPKIALLT